MEFDKKKYRQLFEQCTQEKRIKKSQQSFKVRLFLEKADFVKNAKEFISKAEHYLKATDYLKKGQYSDISATTIFFSLYHSLLAIAAKFGYESRNQECTFALIHYLIEEGKIEFDNSLLNKIAALEPKSDEETSVDIRERFQYGTEFKMDEELYNNMVNLAKEVIVIALL